MNFTSVEISPEFCSFFQVIVKRWSKVDESFLPESKMDRDDVERYVQGVRNYDFDQYLGAYPVEACAKWQYLAFYISPAVLEKLEPVDKVIESQGAIEEQRKREEMMKEDGAKEMEGESTYMANKQFNQY